MPMSNRSIENTNDSGYKRIVLYASLSLASLVIAIVLLISGWFSESEPAGTGKMGGLMSSHLATDPAPITAEDLQDAYEMREPMSPKTQETIKSSMLQYLSRGDFSGLDRFLAAQQQTYRVAEGDDMQEMENWKIQFDVLRNDLAKTVNLTEDNAAQAFSSFYTPEILVAALCYSPISVKLNAFVDWSSILMPAEKADGTRSIKLTPVDIDNPSERLSQLNEMGVDRYIDLLTYHVDVLGYAFDITIVQNEHGFYIPYSMLSTDGLMQNGWTKATVLDLAAHLGSYVNIDSAIYVPRREELELEVLAAQ